MAEADKSVNTETPGAPPMAEPVRQEDAFGVVAQSSHRLDTVVMSSEAAFDGVFARARRILGIAAGIEATVAALTGVTGAALVAMWAVGIVPFSMTLRAVLLAMLPIAACASAAALLWRRAWPLRHALVVGARLEEALRRRRARRCGIAGQRASRACGPWSVARVVRSTRGLNHTPHS